MGTDLKKPPSAATQVAELCNGTPLLMCLVADALGSRVTRQAGAGTQCMGPSEGVVEGYGEQLSGVLITWGSLTLVRA